MCERSDWGNGRVYRKPLIHENQALVAERRGLWRGEGGGGAWQGGRGRGSLVTLTIKVNIDIDLCPECPMVHTSL